MNSVEQLEIWKRVRVENPDEMPEPIASVQDDNRKAMKLVAQINQLAEFGKDETDNE